MWTGPPVSPLGGRICPNLSHPSPVKSMRGDSGHSWTHLLWRRRRTGRGGEEEERKEGEEEEEQAEEERRKRKRRRGRRGRDEEDITYRRGVLGTGRPWTLTPSDLSPRNVYSPSILRDLGRIYVGLGAPRFR